MNTQFVCGINSGHFICLYASLYLPSKVSETVEHISFDRHLMFGCSTDSGDCQKQAKEWLPPRLSSVYVDNSYDMVLSNNYDVLPRNSCPTTAGTCFTTSGRDFYLLFGNVPNISFYAEPPQSFFNEFPTLDGVRGLAFEVRVHRLRIFGLSRMNTRTTPRSPIIGQYP